MVFIFATILSHVFDHDNNLSMDQWNALQAETDAWNTQKPWDFTPLWIGTYNDQSLEPWPELRMSHPAQVVGMQHYYLAKAILAIYDPRLSKLGIASIRTKKASEGLVLDYTRKVMGLAVSNPTVENATFQASHTLSACGPYLTDAREQTAAIKFLEGMQSKMGWRTAHIRRELTEQWGL